MAELNTQLDHEDGEQSFDAVPAGEYTVVITDSDYIDNKKGTGKILKLTYQIIDGPMEGRKIFENLNLENENQVAATIARKALNSLGAAVGIVELKDSVQLHNIPLKIEVGVKDSEEYGKQNRIKKHMPMQESTTKAPAPATSKEKPTAGKTDTSKARPWEKKKG